MARIRSVHPGLFSDEAFVSCSPTTRLLNIGLWTEADDKGVFEWKPLTIKMRLFPADAFDVETMSGMLAELIQANIVRQFDFDGKTYGAIRNFRKYQRPQKPNDIHPMPETLRDYVGLNAAIPEPVMATEPSPEVLADFRNRTVVSVANMRWNNAEHSMLTADVLFQELEALGAVPFTTVADADTAHGVEVWTKANAGDYGAIAEYVAPAPVVPDSVSARQFKLQLLAAGLLDQVEAWVASQSQAVQIAYANSGTFVRGEPMMQEGFTALGFTTAQIDAFFTAAATL